MLELASSNLDPGHFSHLLSCFPLFSLDRESSFLNLMISVTHWKLSQLSYIMASDSVQNIPKFSIFPIHLKNGLFNLWLGCFIYDTHCSYFIVKWYIRSIIIISTILNIICCLDFSTLFLDYYYIYYILYYYINFYITLGNIEMYPL